MAQRLEDLQRRLVELEEPALLFGLSFYRQASLFR
jgi:hypothetical protein